MPSVVLLKVDLMAPLGEGTLSRLRHLSHHLFRASFGLNLFLKF